MLNSSTPTSDEVSKLLGFNWVFLFNVISFPLIPHAYARLHVMPTSNGLTFSSLVLIIILVTYRIDSGINVNDCVHT